MSIELLSRREALWYLATYGLAARVTPAMILAACGGSGTDSTPTGPPVSPPPPEQGPLPLANILGPTQQYLRADRQVLSFPFNNTGSIGQDFLWTTKKPDNTRTENRGDAFELATDQQGIYSVTLNAQSKGRSDATKSFELRVNAPIVSPWSGRTKLAYWYVDGGNVELHIRDDYRDPSSRVAVRGSGGFNVSELSWNPEQTKLLTTYFYPPRATRVVIIDVEKGTITPITQNGLTANAFSWSPSGEWIAYTDDNDTGGQRDWLYIIHPDGTNRIQIGGINGNEYFGSISGAAWTVDEKSIVGGVHQSGAAQPRRVVVFSNLYGTPRFDQLHSESALETFFKECESEVGASINPTGSNLNGASEGINGSVLLHPDGNTVIFGVEFYTATGFYRWTVSAPLNGNGGIKKIASFAGRSTISPDGNTLYIENSPALGAGGDAGKLPYFAICTLPSSGGPVQQMIPTTDTISKYRKPALIN